MRLNSVLSALVTRPSYVAGRFPAVRDGYSALRSLKDRLLAPPPIEIGELYGAPNGSLEPKPSGLLKSEASVAQHVEAIRTKSYSAPMHLDLGAVNELKAVARKWRLHGVKPGGGALFYATYDEFQASPALFREAATASVTEASTHPVVRAIAADPLLLDIAAQYLGYAPRRVSPWLFWSFANDLTDDERRSRFQTIDFHYDVHGLSFLYFYFYLVDTNVRNGAHALIEGTHRNKRMRDMVGSAVLDAERAASAYGDQPVRVLEGPAGYGFVEDASCYHRAMPPLDGERLMLTFRYQ